MAETLSSPREPDEGLDIETLRSRLEELSESVRGDLLGNAGASLDSKNLLEDCLAELSDASHGIELEDQGIASWGPESSAMTEAVLEQLKREITLVGDEKRKIEDEIMNQIRTIHEDSAQLYRDLMTLDYSSKISSSVDVRKFQGTTHDSRSTCGGTQGSIMDPWDDEKFKILQLGHEIEKANCSLSCLENLDYVIKRNEASELIVDMLSEEVKPIEVEGNWIRLSIMTPISTSDGSLLGQKLDCIVEPSVLYHELAIEVVSETMELKSIQIFPNDVCLENIIAAAKSSRQLFSLDSAPSVKLSLECLVRKVRQQIFLCNLRRLMVKDANNSRHSFEYLDKEKTIIVHLVGGYDAFIKVSQGWPISPSPLNLVSIKNLDIHSKGVSLSFFYKIRELANSLDAQTRHCLPLFAEAIEEIYVREMCQEI